MADTYKDTLGHAPCDSCPSNSTSPAGFDFVGFLDASTPHEHAAQGRRRHAAAGVAFGVGVTRAVGARAMHARGRQRRNSQGGCCVATTSCCRLIFDVSLARGACCLSLKDNRVFNGQIYTHAQYLTHARTRVYDARTLYGVDEPEIPRANQKNVSSASVREVRERKSSLKVSDDSDLLT